MTLIIIHIHQSRIIRVWRGEKIYIYSEVEVTQELEWEEVSKTTQEPTSFLFRFQTYLDIPSQEVSWHKAIHLVLRRQ